MRRVRQPQDSCDRVVPTPAPAPAPLILLLWHLQSSTFSRFACPGAMRDASIQSEIDFTPLSHVFHGFHPELPWAVLSRRLLFPRNIYSFPTAAQLSSWILIKSSPAKGLRHAHSETLSKLVANNFINKIYVASPKACYSYGNLSGHSLWRGIETDKLSETIFEKVIQTFILQIFHINIVYAIRLYIYSNGCIYSQ